MKLLFLFLLSLLVVSDIYSAQVNGFNLITKQIVSLKKQEKPIRVYYFISSKCPCSQAHFDHLNDLQKMYPQFEFVGFHSNKSAKRKNAIKHFEQYKIDFPIIEDQGLVFANQFKAVKTPHVYVLGKDDQVIYQGGATNSRNPKRAKKFYLKEVLLALSKGEKSPYKVNKTLGCYIER